MLDVNDVMTRNPEYVTSDAPVQEAINKLFELDVRHLPVVDESSELVGIVSDRDVRDFSRPYEPTQYDDIGATNERDETPVHSLMEPNVMSVHTEDDVTEVIDLMIDHKIGAVPVVDGLNGSLVGIVSYVDILREAADLM